MYNRLVNWLNMNKEQIFQSISKDYENAFCCGRDWYFDIKVYIANNENLKNLSTEDKIKWLNSKGYFVVDFCFSSELMITDTPIKNAAQFDYKQGEYGQLVADVRDAYGNLLGTIEQSLGREEYLYTPSNSSEATPIFDINNYINGLTLIEKDGKSIAAIKHDSGVIEEINDIKISSKTKKVLSNLLETKVLDLNTLETLKQFLEAIQELGYISSNINIDDNLSKFEKDNKGQCENTIKLSLI